MADLKKEGLVIILNYTLKHEETLLYPAFLQKNPFYYG